jgi:hypothetical protein
MKLEKTVYVKVEQGSGGGADYLMADTDIDALVNMGEKIKVGIYQLVEIKTVEGVARFSKGAAR